MHIYVSIFHITAIILKPKVFISELKDVEMT